MMIRKIERVAIIGAGNGGCAAAAELTQLGLEVRLYGRSASTVQPMQAIGGVEHEGVIGDGFTPLALITSDAGEAMNGADAVVVMAPTHAHVNMAMTIAPHLAQHQVIFSAPGHTLTLFPNALRQHGHPAPITCESATLPYICRKVTPTRVRVSRKAAKLKFAAFPATRTQELADMIRPLFPAVSPVPTLLDTVFPYTNAIHHPPALLCNIGRVESGDEYCHYYEGITPSVGRIIDRLDVERQAVASAFECRVDPLPEYFHQIGYTNEAGKAGGTAYSTFQNSDPNRWIKAPKSIDHRFFNEDIPYGLVLLSELGRLAGVPTPACDAVVELASIATGKEFRSEGLTLERLGIAKLSIGELRAVLQEGFGG